MPALPSSGSLSLSQVQASFGGSSPIGMSEYYRGGSYVANNAINSSVPASGAISMSNFYGGSGTTTRSLQVNMDYGYGNSAVGLTSSYFGNAGIISFATNNVSSARSNGYKWYGFRLKNPSGWSKGSDIMLGTFYNSNSYTQPS